MQKQIKDSMEKLPAGDSSEPEKQAWARPTLKAEPIEGATQAVEKEEKVRVVFGQDVLLFGS